MKQIVVDITEEGEVRIENRGFTGKSCVEEARFLKDLLGKEMARQLTAAYYQVDSKNCVKKYLPLCW